MIKIEIFRNGVWSVRAEGEVAGVDAARVAAEVARFAASSYYAHRGFLNGELVAEVAGNVKMPRSRR